MKKIKYKTREQWLEAAVSLLTVKLFKPANYTVPKVRVSCGWPSSRALSRKWAGGECWPTTAADDKTSQIFISPRIKKSTDVLPILIHEVCHAVVGCKAKHGAIFRKCAVAVGLEGKMTATVAGKELQEKMKPLLKSLDQYPHSALTPNQRPTKKQTTRMVLCKCNDCGYQCRTSRKWLDASGAPLCPCNELPMAFEVPKELQPEGDEE